MVYLVDFTGKNTLSVDGCMLMMHNHQTLFQSLHQLILTIRLQGILVACFIGV